MRRGLSGLIVLGLVAGSSVIALAADLDISLVSTNSPVHHGEQVIIVIQTEPGATCRAHVFTTHVSYNLGPRKAAPDGRLTWTLRSAGAGTSVSGQVTTTCNAGGRQGTLTTPWEDQG
jgi:hypothetical protein